ncbi:hypothetical protein [Aurantiacibacter gangjinensis]|uniref:hypothetical protein n=1 Tax=Aurantiacibacter gangjinensis TaxID=502682 RepID=UPI000699EF23|nr:hypothetical protein [Aurantiacibacter gangjinensis]APE29049.1 hypothetical protein BMF35_a2220 [Aurantiacibacter gangjinensis]
MPTRTIIAACVSAAMLTACGGPNEELLAAAEEIDFGDDSSQWANDDECDDPRFQGPGTNPIVNDVDLMKDATDCRAAFLDGTATLRPEAAPAAPAEDDTSADTGEPGEVAMSDTAVDFGDDSSTWANDGECDDPRFEGSAMASKTLEEDRMKDASDCRAAYEAGTITLRDSED